MLVRLALRVTLAAAVLPVLLVLLGLPDRLVLWVQLALSVPAALLALRVLLVLPEQPAPPARRGA